MNYVKLLAILMFMSMILTGCTSSSNIDILKDDTKSLKVNEEIETSIIQPTKNLGATENNESKNKIKTVIKGLTVKYDIFVVLAEMCSIYNTKSEIRTEANYKKKGNESYEYYLWIAKAYNSFSDEMKDNLVQIYKDAWPQLYIQTVADKEDNISIDEIITAIDNSLLVKDKNKNACRQLLPYFYNNFYKAYFESKFDYYDKLAAEMNQKIARDNFDIFEYIEKVSGIKYNENYECYFYYTSTPFSAICIDSGNKKISTLNFNNSTYRQLYVTPFHEFSHEIFKSFTLEPEFKAVAEEMKDCEIMMDEWIKNCNNSYDWNGWCEENLVNGFSMYLENKFYKSPVDRSNYVFDNNFYEYLKDMKFDGSKNSLKDVSINFYKIILQAYK